MWCGHPPLSTTIIRVASILSSSAIAHREPLELGELCGNLMWKLEALKQCEESLMTEVQWRVCSDPRKLLDYHRMKKDPRRLRLLAAACVRLALPADPWIVGIIDVVERFADGQAPPGTKRADDAA